MYTDIINAKNDSQIPLCGSLSIHSKYNPEHEAESFAAEIQSDCNFFIILGIGGGYHIEALKKRFPKAKIIATECSKQALDYISNIPVCETLRKNSDIKLTSLENLSETIISEYKPAIHGNITILPIRQWERIFAEAAEEAKKIIKDSLKIISADFSVQSHFGKIWQKNIFENLKIASESKISAKRILDTIPSEKIAAIIAAGPSLNSSYEILKNNRSEYYIIATDTAFGALLKRGITADAVVSVDGQILSHHHYMHKLSEDTMFIFDLCANPSSVRKTIEAGCKTIFAETGHPLSQYASNYTGEKTFIHLNAGSGTVTIAAASFAKIAGFTKMQFFGADFSYIGGCAYTKGTYFDTLYRMNENKIHNAETTFTNLLYRTEIKKISENQFTTEILESYKTSLNDFLLKNGWQKTDKKGVVIEFKIEKNNKIQENLSNQNFSYEHFISHYKKNLTKFNENELAEKLQNTEFLTLLPLCAWVENKKNLLKFNQNKNSLLLAYSKTLGYTKTL